MTKQYINFNRINRNGNCAGCGAVPPQCCGCGCVPCLPNFCPSCPVFYAVAFDAGGGTPTPLPQAVPYGGMATRPANPVRPGYAFAAWYQAPDFSGDIWNFDSDVVTENLVLYARWLLPV